ncbi:MAG: efflux RND transporter permease subunit [Desulfarculaceae bacterium]|nr:efflux RND transporter permease subunit [Desulfarculaceae bacterium]
MRALGKWSVEHRVTVNLVMIFVIVAGLYTVLNMRREMFPQFALDMIDISVVYPGATPNEVEEGICIKIEEQLKGLEGIKTMYSTSSEGVGSVNLELEKGTDIRETLDDVKTEVDLIDSFPEEAEEPVIVEIKNRDPAITVAVYGDVKERVLRDTAENIRDDLVDTGPISLAEMIGTRAYEISIELSEESMRRYNLSFDQVAAAVESGSIDLPGGKIKTKGEEFVVRAKGRMYTGAEFKRIPVKTRPDGTRVLLGDVADVIDGFEDTDLKARFNGKPAALVQINRTSAQDTIAISDRVIEYVKSQRDNLPDGVKMASWYDLSEMVKDRIDLLLKNGTQGIILVFIVLALFLNLKLAFWVASGIPISFMGAFLVLDYFGASVNMLSLFGFIMTLGILVDDAIIVGENVFSHYSAGKSSKQAVMDSMKQIGGPVLMAVSTTMVAFLPLMHIAGIMGKFIAVMPQAVIAILAFSLVEALIILPAHLDSALSGAGRKKQFVLFSFHERMRKVVEKTQDRFIRKIYTPLLKYTLKNRYFTLTLGIGVLIISIGAVKGEHVPFVFFPKSDSNWVIAEIVYPLGTPFEKTESSIKRIEKAAFKLDDTFSDRVKGEKNLLVNTFSLVGSIPRRDWKPGVHGPHAGEVWIEVQGAGLRPDLPASEVTAKWREYTGGIPGVEKLTFSPLGGGPGGNPIEIQLAGDRFEQLKKAAEDLKKEIAKYPGTFDITDNFRPGKMEKRIRVKEGARSIGVTMADIARQTRQAYYGDEVMKIQRGKDDIKVMVRYGKKERERISSIEEMRIRTPDNREIPLQEVADIETLRGYSEINRVDRKRVVTVISDLNEDAANAREIVTDLKDGFLKDLVKRYPGISFDLEGQAKRTKESIDSLKKGFMLAAMVIFLLLASQFRSYMQPAIIMAAIPFGLVGAIIGHFIMGFPITIISIFGIVALSGIVVNDSLILIDFINNRIIEGDKVEDAVVESGKSRFRPVLLTSFTTIAGLFPLLLETSFQAQFLIPMAVSICFGLLAATVLTLVYVPSLYMIVRDITVKFSGTAPTDNHRSHTEAGDDPV